MKPLLIIALTTFPMMSHADCLREYPKPLTIADLGELDAEETVLLAELQEIEADPELVKLAKAQGEVLLDAFGGDCPAYEPILKE